MKRSMNIGVALIVLAGLFALSGVPNAQADCSNKTLKGRFGFTYTGTRIGGDNPGPRAGVGQFTADGDGGLSGSVTKSKNGSITQNLTVTGTYTVNSDCTGSGTLTDFDGETRNFDFVIVDQHHEVFGIQTDDGRVTTFVLKKHRNRANRD